MECPSCGANVSDSNRRCSECGEKLGWGLSPEAERLGCGLFLLLMGLVFLGGSLYYLMGQRARTAEESVPQVSREERLRRGAFEACRGFVEDQLAADVRPTWPDENVAEATRKLDTGLFHVNAVVNLVREDAFEPVPYVCTTRYSEENRTWALLDVQLNP